MGKEELKNKVKAILDFLILTKDYQQNTISKKLKALNTKISPSSITNLKKVNYTGSKKMLEDAEKGLVKLLRVELCIKYNSETQNFEIINHCTPEIISGSLHESSLKGSVQPKYAIFEGRVNVSEKVSFYKQAEKEIIEIGIRLNTFNDYFTHKRKGAFKEPIIDRLRDGINFKCYVADPESGFVDRYFKDRAAGNNKEEKNHLEMQDIQSSLIKNFTKINKQNFPGKIELYKYTGLPNFHASIIDPREVNASMYISPYLYGISRANCPVIKVEKKANSSLYKTYWKSAKNFIEAKGVQKVVS